MQPTEYWSVAWLFAGGIFSLNWGLGLLLAQKKDKPWVPSGILICTSIWLLSAVFFLSGLVQRYPALFGLHFPFAFIIGPLLYAYAASMRGEPTSLRFHLILPLISIIAIIPYHLSSLGPSIASHLPGRVGLSSMDQFYFHVNGLIKVSLLSYLALASLKTARLIPQERRFFPLLVFFMITMIDLFLGLLGYVLSSSGLVGLSALLLPVLLYALFFASCFWPEMLGSLRHEIQKRKYEKSRLRSLNVAETVAALMHLMKVERAYSDEDLTLASLARELEISPPQLSEILNDHIQKSFTHFINEYRVTEAQNLIEKEPERTLLSIAHAVGFNSKSSFNRAFKHFTGETPQEFKTSNALFSRVSAAAKTIPVEPQKALVDRFRPD